MKLGRVKRVSAPNPRHLPLIAVTAGEPAGIGPDLCAMLARDTLPARIVVIADRDLLAQRAETIGIALELVEFEASRVTPHVPGRLAIRHVPLETHTTAGVLDPANSRYVLRTL